MAKRKTKLPPPPAAKKKRSKKKLTAKERRERLAATTGGIKKKRSKKKVTPKAKTAKQKRASKALTKATKQVKAKTKTVKADGVSMTLAQCRQCLILQVNPGISPAEFAKKAWPDAPGWKAKIRTGTGPKGDPVEKVGGAMNVAAGAALGKLKGSGWADFEMDGRTKRYSLTKTGEAALDAARKAYGL